MYNWIQINRSPFFSFFFVLFSCSFLSRKNLTGILMDTIIEVSFSYSYEMFIGLRTHVHGVGVGWVHDMWAFARSHLIVC